MTSTTITFLSGLALVDPLVKHATRRKNRQLGLVLLEHFLVVLGEVRDLVEVLPDEMSNRRIVNKIISSLLVTWTHKSNFSYLHIGVGAVACNLSCRSGVHSRKLLIVDLLATNEFKGRQNNGNN